MYMCLLGTCTLFYYLEGDDKWTAIMLIAHLE